MKKAKAPKGFPKKSIKVFGQEWTVQYVKGLTAEQGIFGCTNESERMILIDADQSAESARDTLLHEALHAVLHTAGFMEINDEMEEKLVRVLTPGLIDLFRNNEIWF